MKTALVAAVFAACAPLAAHAQDMPVPKMFKGLQGHKGQYKVEFLEGGPAAKSGRQPPEMTVCTDNLMDSAKRAEKKARADPDCKHRLLKDTNEEAVLESVCKERKSTVTLKREGAKSMLMEVASSGPRGEQTMKMRYTHLGACREGQGAVSFDKDSEQCRKLKAQAAKMDPEKQCARAKSDREACEQRIRDAAQQLSAMCS